MVSISKSVGTDGDYCAFCYRDLTDLDPAAESLAAKAGSESILEEICRFQALLSEESQRQYGNENTLKRPL